MQAVIEAAHVCLDNTLLVGVPSLPEDKMPTYDSASGQARGSGIFMGRSVLI